jgi:hypothetical protein
VRWTDRILGIALGVILGVGTVVVFVFVYSEQTVDAPSISGEGPEAHRGGEGGKGGRSHPSPPPVATIRIVGGAPPAAGPAQLHYRRGELVRLRLVSDATVAVQLLGYKLDTAVGAGRPKAVVFKARKAGSFPLVVAASHIDVATIAVR